MLFYSILSIALLAFGFGFVIFFHELGHFLAAKWVGIRVEQFAVGFGHAVLCWRKGLGLRVGTTRPEYEKRAREHIKNLQGRGAHRELAQMETEEERIELAARDLGFGETEYRLNWIPLGGYVKMLGQDDLRPGADAAHPNAYNNKTVGQRMLVVSAGVIMNIILAAIGFTIVFLMGFNAPPAVVGNVVPDSPAAEAGLQVGERILTYDGKYQHDFTKISLNTALSEEGVSVPMEVRRLDGTVETVMVRPRRPDDDPRGFLMMGIGHPAELRGVERRDYVQPDVESPEELYPAETFAVRPGDVITHVEGEAVEVQEYYRLHQALQASGGDPVSITVRDRDGQVREEQVWPRLQSPFSAREPLSFAGLVPRPAVATVMPNSVARGKILPGDAIVAVSLSEYPYDRQTNLTSRDLMNWLDRWGPEGVAVSVEVQRGDEIVILEEIVPMRLGGGRFGFGIGLGYDEYNPVVATVTEGSPAAAAGIPAGARISSIGGQPVNHWFDVHRLLASVPAGEPAPVAVELDNGAQRTYELSLTDSQIASLGAYQYVHSLALHNRVEPRQTGNPFIAAWWGVTETRDFVLQFYLTLQRMFQGSVSYTNMMGPVGIFHAGYTFAFRGTDWLIWFLALISANLAVVNFLPIPIVDGGLFMFLIFEKIKGKPISARTQAVAQVIGLAILLSVFLLVTYQDIARFFRRRGWMNT